MNGQSKIATLRRRVGVTRTPDAAPALSADEEAGLEQAIDSLRHGQGVPAETVFRRVEERLRR